MPRPRSATRGDHRLVPFPEDCPLRYCVELLASAWTWDLLWYLKQRPLTFGELRRAIPRISAKILTQRLRSMERHLLVERQPMDTRPVQVQYRLGELGRQHLATLSRLGRLGGQLQEAVRNQSDAAPSARRKA